MFFVAGITGQIGGATARALLGQSRQVRALVRDTAKANTWVDKGVDVLAGDLTDPEALAAALVGVDGAFLMQPTPFGVNHDFPEAHALNASIVKALDRAPPPRAVVLSSVGSEQDTGLGNITQTHLLEQALQRFTFPLAIVRPGSLVENYIHSLSRADETGVFDSFLQPVERGFPMTATADVGAEVARLLVEGWDGHKIIEVGSRRTPVELAAAMEEVLGKRIEAKAIPREYWSAALSQMGLTPEQAANWEEMQDGFNSGWIDFGRSGTESFPGTMLPADIFAQAIRR